VKVFFEIGRVPLWSAGRDTLIGDELATLGYQNVADIRGYKPFGAESLAKADPDVYIVTADKAEKPRILSELRKIPSLRGLRCVKEGKVVVVPPNWVLRPGPRLPLGMKEMARQVNQFKISR
jgi:iron complex transport system substrate-binding protein